MCSEVARRIGLLKKKRKENVQVINLFHWQNNVQTVTDSEANLSLFLLWPKKKKNNDNFEREKKNCLNLLSSMFWCFGFDLFVSALYDKNSISNFIVKKRKKNISSIQRFFVSSGLCRLLVALCRSFCSRGIVWQLVSNGQTFHIFRCYF